jgi:hypothetical protein
VVATFEKSEIDHLEHQLIASEASLASSRRLLIALMAIAFILSGAGGGDHGSTDLGANGQCPDNHCKDQRHA